jgi:hypothetical protein
MTSPRSRPPRRRPARAARRPSPAHGALPARLEHLSHAERGRHHHRDHQADQREQRGAGGRHQLTQHLADSLAERAARRIAGHPVAGRRQMDEDVERGHAERARRAPPRARATGCLPMQELARDDRRLAARDGVAADRRPASRGAPRTSVRTDPSAARRRARARADRLPGRWRVPSEATPMISVSGCAAAPAPRRAARAAAACVPYARGGLNGLISLHLVSPCPHGASYPTPPHTVGPKTGGASAGSITLGFRYLVRGQTGGWSMRRLTALVLAPAVFGGCGSQQGDPPEGARRADAPQG